jgi:hypothetical protein
MRCVSSKVEKKHLVVSHTCEDFFIIDMRGMTVNEEGYPRNTLCVSHVALLLIQPSMMLQDN